MQNSTPMENPKELTIRLADELNRDQIEVAFGDAGGIYRLYATENGQPKPVPRVLGNDFAGTLYIGKADSFVNRVIELKKSCLPNYKTNSHKAGVRYKNHTGLQAKYPLQNLMVLLAAVKNPVETERQALDLYISQFGEVPPLNAI
jgi:hypothetical protein